MKRSTPACPYPLTAGATRGSVRNHACAIVPTVLLRALIIKAQPCRRAHIISNDNSFIHDVPRGHAQQGWGEGGRQGGAAPSSAETEPRLPPFARCLPGGRGYARPPQTPLPGRRCSFIAYSRWWRHCENRGGRHGAILPPVKSTHGEGGSPGAKISRHGRGAKKWLNFKKTAAGHVEKKKNGTVNISETSRVARDRGPPAP